MVIKNYIVKNRYEYLDKLIKELDEQNYNFVPIHNEHYSEIVFFDCIYRYIDLNYYISTKNNNQSSELSTFINGNIEYYLINNRLMFLSAVTEELKEKNIEYTLIHDNNSSELILSDHIYRFIDLSYYCKLIKASRTDFKMPIFIKTRDHEELNTLIAKYMAKPSKNYIEPINLFKQFTVQKVSYSNNKQNLKKANHQVNQLIKKYHK